MLTATNLDKTISNQSVLSHYPPHTFLREYKLVFLGNAKVGKTAFILKFIQNYFIQDYEPTIEDAYRKQITVDGVSLIVECVDTAGQGKFKNIFNIFLIQN
jgi:small GTP-binding protein